MAIATAAAIVLARKRTAVAFIRLGILLLTPENPKISTWYLLQVLADYRARVSAMHCRVAMRHQL
jgi:hypothetical protein